MKEKNVIDLKGKSPEEVMDAYKIIASENIIINEIWKKTNNLEEAQKVYQQYLAEKESKGNNQKQLKK